VPAGYPTDPEAGAAVAVDEESVAAAAGDDAEALLYYASVDAREDGVYTTTSRSFAVVGVTDSIGDAEAIVERALGDAGEGFRVRHDIGTDELVADRVAHMDDLRE
jgi:phosphoribosylamine--glycine ligase